MAIFRLKDNMTRPVVFTATGLFLCFAVLFFTGADIPHKLVFPLVTLTVASLWLCPWQMSLALLFSAVGDWFGSMGAFLPQMGAFAVAHIWMIVFFAGRYFSKVEHDRKLTGKAKGYLAMVIFCALALLSVTFIRIVPEVPAGVLRIGVGIYACLICMMLVSALLQRSSLYALGAVLFVFSDFILAWNRFVEAVPHADMMILVPYYLGQWLLFVRSTRYRIAQQKRLLRF